MEDSVLSRYVKSLMSKTIRQALGQPLLPSSVEQVDYVINAEVARWHTIGEFYAAQAATGEYHPIRQLRRVSGSEDDVGLSKIENSKLGWSRSNPLQLIFSNHHGETFDEREGYLGEKNSRNGSTSSWIVAHSPSNDWYLMLHRQGVRGGSVDSGVPIGVTVVVIVPVGVRVTARVGSRVGICSGSLMTGATVPWLIFSSAS